MIVKVISSREELDKSKYIWNQISEYNTIFSLYEWFSNWWNCYGKQKELRIYIAEDDKNRVSAILPLMKYQKDGKIFLTQLAESGTDYFSVISDAYELNDLKEILCYIKNNENYDRFILSNLKSDENSTDLLLKAARDVYNDIEIINQGKIYFVNINGSFDDYVITRSKNFRHKYNQLRKIENRYNFEVVDTYSRDIIDEVIELHKKRWLGEMQLSVFYDQRRVNFTHSIFEDFSKLGYFRLFLLKNESRIVSYRMGFVFGNKYYDWNTAFDLEYSNDSVGVILCNHVIDYCFANGIKEFDFLRGEEAYKQKFSTDNRNYLAVEFKTQKELEEYIYIPPRQKILDSVKNLRKIIWTLKYDDNFKRLQENAIAKGIVVENWNNRAPEKNSNNDLGEKIMIIGDDLDMVLKLSCKYNCISCFLINKLSNANLVGKPDVVITDMDEIIELLSDKGEESSNG